METDLYKDLLQKEYNKRKSKFPEDKIEAHDLVWDVLNELPPKPNLNFVRKQAREVIRDNK